MDKLSPERCQQFLEAAATLCPDGLLAAEASGLIVAANPAIEEMLGAGFDELLGRRLTDLFPTQMEDCVQHFLATGVAQPGSPLRHMCHMSGNLVPVKTIVGTTPLPPDHLRVIIVKRIPDDNGMHATLIKAVLDHALDGVAILDENGIILSANEACETIFASSAAQLESQSIWSYIAKSEHGLPDPGTRTETMGRRSDGKAFPLELSIADASTAEGRFIAAFLRDLSDRQMHEETTLAKESVERTNRARSEFLSRMSHELRTPLNAVIGYAQLLNFKFQEPEVQEGTRSILKAGRHLLSLINEVLDLARIDTGRMAISLEPVQVSLVIQNAIELITPIAQESKITLDYRDGTCLEEAALADRQRLLQVFINLISNGIKYNRPYGQVTIRCELINDTHVRVVIEDTGVGILEVDRERLFQPFERLGTQVTDGSGLGLVLSKRFVELMGGRLDLLSSSPQGSRFAVDLRRTSMPVLKQTGPGESRAPRPTFERQLRILYIEDNTSNMKLMEMILSEWRGVSMIPAVQGQIGLEIARTHLPDLILLDLHLPDMPGEQVLRLLKTSPETGDIPVIVISADSTDNQIRRLRDAGAAEYVTKPIDIRQFTMVVERVLNLAH